MMNSLGKSMCHSLFETIKIVDGCPALLHWHQARVDHVFESLGLSKRAIPHLSARLASCVIPPKGVYKCRIDYRTDGEVNEPVFALYSPRLIDVLHGIDAHALDYSHKWADRATLSELGAELPIDDEVLILRDGWVTDTRYSNVVFGDPHEHDCPWVTPTTYLLKGVKRSSLLASGAIVQRAISWRDVARYPYCSLINAMLDPGDVVIPVSRIIKKGSGTTL
ncbi:MAG: hypothetical protein RR889_03900 [Akkermansia sp.]